jgi:3-isopropylmalate dehydrogenase
MMLRSSLGLAQEADAVVDAVNKVLADGFRTGDILQKIGENSGEKLVGTREMTRIVVETLLA